MPFQKRMYNGSKQSTQVIPFYAPQIGTFQNSPNVAYHSRKL